MRSRHCASSALASAGSEQDLGLRADVGVSLKVGPQELLRLWSLFPTISLTTNATIFVGSYKKTYMAFLGDLQKRWFWLLKVAMASYISIVPQNDEGPRPSEGLTGAKANILIVLDSRAMFKVDMSLLRPRVLIRELAAFTAPKMRDHFYRGPYSNQNQKM